MSVVDELRALLARAENRRTETGIPRVAMVRGQVPEHELSAVYEPMINVVLQGEKTLRIGDRTLLFDRATYFVASVDLPAVGTVRASRASEPYLAVSLTLDPEILAEVVEKAPTATARGAGFAVAPMTPELLDAWARLLRLTARPEEIPVLAPLYEREILFRVLQGPQGHVLRDIAVPDGSVARVRAAIAWIRAHYARPMRIAALARLAKMSEAAFHRHFRAVTRMTPLQFQKRLRLMRARALLVERRATASEVAFEVGYESASQFSREYVRLFGKPPASDARDARAALRSGAARSSRSARRVR